MRKSEITRKTRETSITVSMNFEEFTRGEIKTGSGFLDHMLDLFQMHSGIGLVVRCEGDTWIDMHHSAEDIAICFGQALKECLGDKKGIERYGFYYVTMDETLARCCLDFSGRYGFAYEAPIKMTRIGNLDTELVKHFFHSVAENAAMNLHLDIIRGENTHHMIEGMFKAFARATAMAIGPSARVKGIPSSKDAL